MDDVDRGRPFYERRWFQGAAAVVALAGAVVALVGAPSIWDSVAGLDDPPALPASNTEIVLDASAAMSVPLGSAGTKLDAAADAAGDFAVPLRNEGLALRGFGGGCDEVGRLLVDFGENHGDDVRSAAGEQQPGGKSNLSNAVIAAIDDFADGERFPDRDSPKRVIVFAGTVDNCRGAEAADEIRREVKRAHINAVFKLVGVKVSAPGRERLLDFGTALGKSVDVAFVDTPEQLAAVVDWLDTAPGGGECADGVDNDGDGLIDDPGDPGCADGTEADTAPGGGECADGVDNDADGLTDEPADPGCADGTEADTPPGGGECAEPDDPNCAPGTEDPAAKP